MGTCARASARGRAARARACDFGSPRDAAHAAASPRRTGPVSAAGSPSDSTLSPTLLRSGPSIFDAMAASTPPSPSSRTPAAASAAAPLATRPAAAWYAILSRLGSVLGDIPSRRATRRATRTAAGSPSMFTWPRSSVGTRLARQTRSSGASGRRQKPRHEEAPAVRVRERQRNERPPFRVRPAWPPPEHEPAARAARREPRGSGDQL